jgi:hypothetical protein
MGDSDKNEVRVNLTQIDPQPYRDYYLHGIREPLVAGMVDTIENEGYNFPPVLVVEGTCILDGHHRLEAAGRAGVDKVDAYVIDADDFQALLDSKFDGEIPDRLAELDDDIILPEGGEYNERARKKEIKAS